MRELTGEVVRESRDLLVLICPPLLPSNDTLNDLLELMRLTLIELDLIDFSGAVVETAAMVIGSKLIFRAINQIKSPIAINAIKESFKKSSRIPKNLQRS